MPKIDNAEHCVCCGQVIPEGSQYCVICGYKAKHKKTNYDRIKAMSVEKMAEFLYSAPDKVCFENCAKDTGNKFFCKFGENVEASNCIACMKQYLESECDNNA